MNTVYLLLSVVILSACVTKGRHFPSDLSWITKEVTKKDDVLLLLGRPFMVGSAGGIMTWSYGRYNYSLVGRDYIKELKIYWNDDNTVRDYSFQSSFPSDMRKAGVLSRRAKRDKNKTKIHRQNTSNTKKHKPLIDKELESVIEKKGSELKTILENSPKPDTTDDADETNAIDNTNSETQTEHTDSANHSE